MSEQIQSSKMENKVLIFSGSTSKRRTNKFSACDEKVGGEIESMRICYFEHRGRVPLRIVRFEKFIYMILTSILELTNF